MIDGRHILAVDADQAEGKAIGVTGTPTYVTAERLDGGKSQELRERVEEIADRLLANGPGAGRGSGAAGLGGAGAVVSSAPWQALRGPHRGLLREWVTVS
ncbi:hypothetical protein SCANM63S_09841 [Streptomyces canarius]